MASPREVEDNNSPRKESQDGSQSKLVAGSMSRTSQAGLGISNSDSRRSSLKNSRYVASAEDLMPDPVDDASENEEEDQMKNEDEEEDQDAVSSSSKQDDLERPDFHPFFTVVQDSSSGVNAPHHPHVHYIFSDDDTEPITSALLRSLDPSASDLPHSDELKERIVIVDLAADGKTVLKAKSLAPDWQVTDTSVQAAPTFDDVNAPKEAGLMLSITGAQGQAIPSEELDEEHLLEQHEAAAGSDVFAALESLAEQYNQEMESLKHWSQAESDVS